MKKNEKISKAKSQDTAKKRKKAEETLHHSEERYRTILENIEEGYYEVDLAGNFTFFNDTLCRVSGYSREELMGMNNRQYTDQEELRKLFQAYNKVYTTGEPNKEFGQQITRKDGAKRYIEGSISLQKDSSGKPIGFKGIARDITEHKKVEESLKKSEEQYRLLADNITEHVWLMELNPIKTIYVSPSVEKMYGYTSDEIINLSLKKLLTEESVQKMRDAYATEMPKALANPLPYVHTYSLELQACHKDGHLLWIENTLSIIRDENGKPAFILGETRDITEHKQMESQRKAALEAMRESEQKYRFLTEKMSDIIWIADMNLRTTYVSPSVKNILGFSQEERMRQTLNEQLTPHSLSLVMEALTRELALEKQGNADPNRTLTIELEYYHKDGSTLWMNLVISGIRNDQGVLTSIHGVARDITERKKAEEALRESGDLYRTIFENTGTSIILIEEDMTISMSNGEFARNTGYSPDEINGRMKWTEIIHPDDLRRMVEQHRLRRESERRALPSYEFRYITKTGELLDTLLTIKLVPGTKKSIASLIDITERKRTEEKLQKTFDSLKKAIGATIQVMVSAVEARDPYTAGHQIRSAHLACAIATEMGLPQEKIDGIRMAGSIHDIGKLSIPAEILSKPTKLTEIEFSLIKEHSRSGYEMLKDVESPWPLAQIVYQHHERMNGSGYPRNLKGDEIIMEARIMAVADVVEANASHRPYRPGLGIEAALEEIEKNKGILYDNTVADACLRLFREKGYQLT
jgi:PAS domain S-box-containing protein